MSLTLYIGQKRYSSWSLRPYLALAHTGASFETKMVLLNQPNSKEELLKVSPSGRVPALEHDGLLIWDSLAICEYANELFPEAKLWPEDRAKRARARAISAEMHSGFLPMRQAMPMNLDARKTGMEFKPEILAEARRIQEIWRDALAASGGPFLFGAFTIADAMFAPVTTRFTTYGIDMDATCRAYVDAIAALPSMQQWYADAVLEPRFPE